MRFVNIPISLAIVPVFFKKPRFNPTICPLVHLIDAHVHWCSWLIRIPFSCDKPLLGGTMPSDEVGREIGSYISDVGEMVSSNKRAVGGVMSCVMPSVWGEVPSDKPTVAAKFRTRSAYLSLKNPAPHCEYPETSFTSQSMASFDGSLPASVYSCTVNIIQKFL